ncbi:MAG: hypothetical protein WC901_06390 [Candidatus Margulisiibacteriota bacterium]
MKLWVSKTHSDEGEDLAKEGKLVIIKVTKEDVRQIASFFQKVSLYLKENDFCHMHFRDFLKGWNRKDDIDIQVDVVPKK